VRGLFDTFKVAMEQVTTLESTCHLQLQLQYIDWDGAVQGQGAAWYQRERNSWWGDPRSELDKQGERHLLQWLCLVAPARHSATAGWADVFLQLRPCRRADRTATALP
jgi:hypothetical protein